MEIRQAIAILAERYGSQRRLADFLGISQGYLSDIKSGRRTGGKYVKEIIKLATDPMGIPLANAINVLSQEYGSLRKLAKALGVSHQYLSKVRRGKKLGLPLRERIIKEISKETSIYKKIDEIPDIKVFGKEGLSWERSIMEEIDLSAEYRWFARFKVKVWVIKGGGSVRKPSKLKNVELITDIVTVFLTYQGELLISPQDFFKNWKEIVENARQKLLADPAIEYAELLYVFRHFRKYRKGVPILESE